MTNLRFFYNGIKTAEGRYAGQLQKAWYSDAKLCNSPAGTITIYARDYEHFSAEIRAAFVVVNNSDSMTDYFENDRIRVEPSHPLYAEVSAALNKMKAHGGRRNATAPAARKVA